MRCGLVPGFPARGGLAIKSIYRSEAGKGVEQEPPADQRANWPRGWCRFELRRGPGRRAIIPRQRISGSDAWQRKDPPETPSLRRNCRMRTPSKRRTKNDRNARSTGGRSHPWTRVKRDPDHTPAAFETFSGQGKQVPWPDKKKDKPGRRKTRSGMPSPTKVREKREAPEEEWDADKLWNMQESPQTPEHAFTVVPT